MIPDDTTLGRIAPLLRETYGSSPMVVALAKELAGRIDNFEDRDLAYYGDRQREDMIRNTCWNWFSGGSTAANVASRIENALLERVS